MAHGSRIKTTAATVAFAASCVAGLAATAYGITTAYLMGSRAQAEIDETTPANPILLVRSSFKEIMRMAPNGPADTISVEEDAVEVNTLE